MAIAFELAMFGWFARAIEAYTGTPRLVGLVLLVLARAAPPAAVPVTCALARWLARRRGAGAAAARAHHRVRLDRDRMAVPEALRRHDRVRALAVRRGCGRRRTSPACPASPSCCCWATSACSRRCAPSRAGRPASRRWRRRPRSVALSLALAGYGAARERAARELPTGRARVRVGIVQADISRYGRMAAQRGTGGAVRDHPRRARRSCRRSCCGAVGSICWSGPRPSTRRRSARRRARTAPPSTARSPAFVARVGVPLVFGAYDAEDGAEFNAAVFLEPPRGGRARVRDLPQGVALPAHRARARRASTGRARRGCPGSGRGRRAAAARWSRSRCADGRRLPVAPLICYDALAPGQVRAAVRARRRADRHAVERRLVRRRPGGVAASRRRRVPQHRDAPAAGARDQHRHLRGDRRRRLDRRAGRRRHACGAGGGRHAGGARDDARAALGPAGSVRWRVGLARAPGGLTAGAALASLCEPASCPRTDRPPSPEPWRTSSPRSRRRST